MFFSKSLAVVATLALGAISSVVARPAPLETSNVLARCGCNSPAGIITGVTTSIQVYTGQLRGLAATEVTVDAVVPIVSEITNVLVGATTKINGLLGKDADIILADADGSAQVTAVVVAQLIAALCAEIFGAIGVIVNLGGVVGISAIISIFVSLGEVLGVFCGSCFSIFAGVGLDVKVALSPLLGGDILAVVARLNLSVLQVALGLRL
ncbi:hypothetical protein BDY19DRAFT_997735 [Irpex rosettiformis]|uniref:Uncharacterized protein n=1 Tax=Irpex rosettiformis TaxID=378272 RepID=A0ACB8TR18_9APHY|nr:hypothetical protein BDY19DRAFT_997735 [Irpex rosettiformis]